MEYWPLAGVLETMKAPVGGDVREAAKTQEMKRVMKDRRYIVKARRFGRLPARL